MCTSSLQLRYINQHLQSDRHNLSTSASKSPWRTGRPRMQHYFFTTKSTARIARSIWVCKHDGDCYVKWLIAKDCFVFTKNSSRSQSHLAAVYCWLPHVTSYDQPWNKVVIHWYSRPTTTHQLPNRIEATSCHMFFLGQSLYWINKTHRIRRSLANYEPTMNHPLTEPLSSIMQP